MTAAIKPPFHDSLFRLAQIGTTTGMQLVRLTACRGGNQYDALPIEFAADGTTHTASDRTLTVLNLAEPADAAGTVPAGTDVVALDVEGRWVAFVRQAASAASVAMPARIVAPLGQAKYTVRPQTCSAAGTFVDAAGAADLQAVNLAELSLGTGAAMDPGTIVLVSSLADAAGTTRYVFDHPAYAKYLD